jgi:Fe-S cluster assembly protein SufB
MSKHSIIKSSNYKYGFSDDNSSSVNLKKGLSESVVRQISAIKKEPAWMLQIRLKAYQSFLKLKNPKWGPNLDFIDFDDYIYYASMVDKINTK